MTRDNIRDAASTLAHHWTSGEPRDWQGVERLLLSYPISLQRPLCALVLLFLQERGWYTRAAAFERFLFDLAELPPDVYQKPGNQEYAYVERAFADAAEVLDGND
jgi:hypothetical protein